MGAYVIRGRGGGGRGGNNNGGGGGYIRFGQTPQGGRSINFRALNGAQRSDLSDALDEGWDAEAYIDNQVEHGYKPWKGINKDEVFEKGVSVFKADESGLPIIENIQQANSLAMRIEKPAYQISGNNIGLGQDGEPIIAFPKSTSVKIPQEKLVATIENALTKNFKRKKKLETPGSKTRVSEFFDWKTNERSVVYGNFEYLDAKSDAWAHF